MSVIMLKHTFCFVACADANEMSVPYFTSVIEQVITKPTDTKYWEKHEHVCMSVILVATECQLQEEA